jgi:hypothetical protein
VRSADIERLLQHGADGGEIAWQFDRQVGATPGAPASDRNGEVAGM